MNPPLSEFQTRLIAALQNGLPICAKPFARIAELLNCTEEEVLRETNLLKTQGVIRRIGVKLNYRALGRTATLVAAAIPEKILAEVTEAVNSLQNVSHNYLRQHRYNLWFTLQADSASQINETLNNLSFRFGINFLNLPAVRIFKLDVRFDAGNTTQVLQDVDQPCEVIDLNSNEKTILNKIQEELPIISEPFESLATESFNSGDVLKIVTELMNKGVIQRIAAVVYHQRLGFVANVMFVSKVGPERTIEAGSRLASLQMVSHCYERKTCNDWTYNLFAMMHGRSMAEIQKAIDGFIKDEKIDSFELLPTLTELKKQPVKISLTR